MSRSSAGRVALPGAVTKNLPLPLPSFCWLAAHLWHSLTTKAMTPVNVSP
jgi:hypothetical protein